MKTSIARSRIRNAIVFFAQNTKACGKIKLFKLLYLLDFEHFRQTGKSVTGFDYEAWKFGPVPVSLMQEWEDLEEDLAATIEIVPERVIDYTRETVKVKPNVEFCDDDFTLRQTSIMQGLAEKYRETLSPKMIDVTHVQNGAWDKIWANGLGAQQPIPYDLAIPDDASDREYILESASESKGLSKALEPEAY